MAPRFTAETVLSYAHVVERTSRVKRLRGQLALCEPSPARSYTIYHSGLAALVLSQDDTTPNSSVLQSLHLFKRAASAQGLLASSQNAGQSYRDRLTCRKCLQAYLPAVRQAVARLEQVIQRQHIISAFVEWRDQLPAISAR